MLSWVQSVWEMHASQNIYGASCSDGASNAFVEALPLQIGVWVAIAVLFIFFSKFSDSCDFTFSTSTNFPFKGATGES